MSYVDREAWSSLILRYDVILWFIFLWFLRLDEVHSTDRQRGLVVAGDLIINNAPNRITSHNPSAAFGPYFYHLFHLFLSSLLSASLRACRSVETHHNGGVIPSLFWGREGTTREKERRPQKPITPAFPSGLSLAQPPTPPPPPFLARFPSIPISPGPSSDATCEVPWAWGAAACGKRNGGFGKGRP